MLYIIIAVIILLSLIIIVGIIIAIIITNSSEDNEKNDENNDDKEEIKDQEISITIEVFKFRKNQGKKPHEIPNINEEVFFLSEEFKSDEKDFEMIFDGKTQNFSKNFTFKEEGNYTVTYKFSKKFESFSSMFYNCYYITSINFTNIKSDNLINLSKMFYNCDGLLNIYLNGLNTKNVKDMGYMFLGCSSLTSLDLTNLVFE